jgi:hypothetical protein
MGSLKDLEHCKVNVSGGGIDYVVNWSWGNG